MLAAGGWPAVLPMLWGARVTCATRPAHVGLSEPEAGPRRQWVGGMPA